MLERQPTSIVHFDLDTFFVSVERIIDQKLERKPVIVGGDPFGRGVVAGCSYEAREFGVHSAMPIRTAYKLCPNGIYLRGHYEHYAEYSRYVTSIMQDLAPVVEKSSVDEFYLDLSHCERLKGDTRAWAAEIQKTVRGETTLPISFGLAQNKLVAKVATVQMAKHKDNLERNYQVASGNERGFLAPFAVRAIPGIGQVMEHELNRLGIQKVGQLAITPVQLLARSYGKTGRSLHDKANGIDHSPVIQSREQKSYSREQTFGEDLLEVDKLLDELLSLSSRLAEDLRKASVLTEKITLKLRYTDFMTVTKGLGVSMTNSDQDIYKIVLKLFRALWTRRIRVRLLGIEATSLLPDLRPVDLFDPAMLEEDSHDQEPGLRSSFERRQDHAKLGSVFDTLRQRYGNSSIIGYAPTVAATV